MRVQKFVTVVSVGEEKGEARFVVTNEATGRHFSANRTSVNHLESLRRFGDPTRAAREARLDPADAARLLGTLVKHGVVVAPGSTKADETPAKGPVEGRLIAIKKDLFDVGGLARRLNPVGRFLFSWPATVLWVILMIVAGVDLIRSADRLVLALSNLRDLGVVSAIGFVVVFLVSKAIHEMGHALAYRRMCQIEDLSPGPIRVGLMVFAATPFPFTDVTGAWRLRSKWRRALIGAAGIYAESWLMLLIVLYWANTSPSALADLVLQVAIVSGGMALLFNLNPAVKLDGYYIMSDLFRQPNLAGRASAAARALAARWLGADLPAPPSLDLAYWVVSYLYRWTIFIGIFWLAWQFDPRLGPLIAIVSVMMLLMRPIHATLRFAREQGAKPVRFAALGVLVLVAGAALLWPFPARMLADANLHRFETRFVTPPDAGVVRLGDGGNSLEVDSETLKWRLADARLRLEGLRTIARAVPNSAAQQSRTQTDLASMEKVIGESERALMRQSVGAPEAAVWTTLAAEVTDGMTVTSEYTDPLAAVSEPVAPYLRIELAQDRLDTEADLSTGTTVQARFVSDPSCDLRATISSGARVVDGDTGRILVRAQLEGAEPACAAALTSGSAAVVRVDLPPRSMAKRLRLLAFRLLQDRLPI